MKQEEVKQEEVKQEVRIIGDDATRSAKPCPSSIKEEVKPKHGNRPESKEKANCPECGKEITTHGLKYTHKRK